MLGKGKDTAHGSVAHYTLCSFDVSLVLKKHAGSGLRCNVQYKDIHIAGLYMPEEARLYDR